MQGEGYGVQGGRSGEREECREGGRSAGREGVCVWREREGVRVRKVGEEEECECGGRGGSA